jgi:hypothetical protein
MMKIDTSAYYYYYYYAKGTRVELSPDRVRKKAMGARPMAFSIFKGHGRIHGPFFVQGIREEMMRNEKKRHKQGEAMKNPEDQEARKEARIMESWRMTRIVVRNQVRSVKGGGARRLTMIRESFYAR